MMKTNFITLPDGRQLAYAEFGDPTGHPVIHFHGGGSSRLEPLLLGDEFIRQFGLRLISPDRPGIGQSDNQPNRGFSDWPQDVVVLADALGLDKFSVLGISGGGGYVAACAAKIPDRLLSAVIVSGAWDRDNLQELPLVTRWIYGLAQKFPRIYEVVLKLMLGSFQGNPEKALASVKKQSSLVDYAVLEPRIQAYQESMREAIRQGMKGIAWDVLIYLRPRDFDIQEIHIPLKLFHGEQDRNIPTSMAKQFVDRIPTAQLITYPNEGHLSVMINEFAAIAQALKNEISN
jgi:pimeloyl-ACP methyl ester carboxylesterase